MASFTLSTVMPSLPAMADEPIRLAQADDATSEGGANQIEQNLDRVFAEMDVLDARLDRSAFDVSLKARALSLDARRIFAFVHDEVTFEPYVGVLRGAAGTLQAGAGNALDQSLLLAALLRQAGYETKIAAGSLSDPGIESLLGAFFATHQEPLEEPWTEAEWQDFMARLDGMGEDVTPALAQQETSLDEASVRFWERVDFHQALLDRVMPTAEQVGAPDLRAESRRHYWVRYLDETGTWFDLDPSLPDAGFGGTGAIAEMQYEELPEALWHRLSVTSSIFATDEEDAIVEHVVLEHELRIADLVGRGIVFRNIPDRSDAPNAADFASWIGGIAELTATLTVGDESIPGMTFDMQGNVYDSPASISDRALGGAGDALGDIINLMDGETPIDDGPRLVGQRITYSLLLPTPDAAEPSVTRYSRDLASPHRVEKWDPAGPQLAVAERERVSMVADLLTRVELTPVAGRMTSAFLAAQEIDTLRAKRDLLAAIMEAARTRTTPAMPAEESTRPGAPLAALGLAIEAQGLLAMLLANRFPDVTLYRAEPALIAFETGYGLSEGQVVGRRGYDIIHSRQRALAGADGRFVPEVARLAGVVETLLESELLRPLADVPLPKPLGTAEVFEAAVQQSVDLVLLRAATAHAELAALAIPEGVKADIAGDLARGYAVIVPARAPDVDGKAEIAWWRIDPDADATLGMVPGGGGSSSAEDIITIIINSLANMDAAIFFGDMMIGMMVGLTCIIDSDASDTSSPGEAQVADMIACIALGVVVTVGIYSPASHARRMAIAGAMIAAFIASTNRIWMRG